MATSVGASTPAAAAPDKDAAASARASYFPEFEGLRAIAALLVVVVHTAFASGFTTHPGPWGRYTARGEIGVSVFFLISGFLLYRPFVRAHLADSKGPRVGPYLLRRAARILPLYWLVLTVAIALHATKPVVGAGGWISFYTLTQVYTSQHAIGGITQAWSLDIEVTFYLLLPVYALALRKLDRRTRLGAAGCGSRRPGSLRCWCSQKRSRSGRIWRSRRMRISWATGCRRIWTCSPSAWHWRCSRRPPTRQRSEAGFPAGRPRRSWPISAGCSRDSRCLAPVGSPACPGCRSTRSACIRSLLERLFYGLFGLFVLLPAVLAPNGRGLIRRFLRCRPMAYAGLISYGIYLWHQVVLDKLLDWTPWRLFTAPWGELLRGRRSAITLVIASITYVLIERPGMSIGRRATRLRQIREAEATRAR